MKNQWIQRKQIKENAQKRRKGCGCGERKLSQKPPRLQKNNPLVQFDTEEIVIWGNKTLERGDEAQKQVDGFLVELVDFVHRNPEFTHNLNHNLTHMDFRSLYAKYPRVRIGIRRALLIARKLEEVCYPTH